MDIEERNPVKIGELLKGLKRWGLKFLKIQRKLGQYSERA